MDDDAKPTARYDFRPRRTLRISYVPEKRFSTWDWADEFSAHFPPKRITTLIDAPEGQGDAEAANFRDNPCYTDFLVVFTAAYGRNPPAQLSLVTNGAESADTTLLWMAKLHPDDFRLFDFGRPDDWHVLPGSGEGGVFKPLSENQAHAADMAKAVKLILEHPDCDQASPVCPRLAHAAATASDGHFDVFLSHNSQDKPVVRELAQALKARGLAVWLDEERLLAGQVWQNELERIIQIAPAAAICLGGNGLGFWHEQEMRACLDALAKRKRPVIPVLLPGAPAADELPLFLRNLTWVDLRGGLGPEGVDKLARGIKGPPAEASASGPGAKRPASWLGRLFSRRKP